MSASSNPPGPAPRTTSSMSGKKKGCLGCLGCGGILLVLLLIIGIIGAFFGPNDSKPESSPSTSSTSSSASSPSPSLTPSPSPTRESATPSQSPSPSSTKIDTGTTAQGDAAKTLASLPVKGRAPKTGYSREQFGQAWADVDHNGCDTRNDILKRDMTDETFKPNTGDCKVTHGTLADPYTATEISYTAGQDTSSAVQIDHVVALSNAWQTGAQQLDADTREHLANDPLNLLAVDGPANQQKSDADAATWLPGNKGYRCHYVARQIAVKATYHLWVTQPERDAMTGILQGCPGEPLPGRDAGPTVDVAPTPAPAPTTQAPAAPTQAAAPPAAPAPEQPQAPEAPAEPAPPQEGNVYYPTCAAARAAGAAPIHQGQPGYSRKLDRDGDGVACEAKS